MNQDVLIVGAGISGLCCARTLQQHGIAFQLLEASDGVGGRIRTDLVDGFRLDRGFQVLLTSYPEAAKNLDFSKLRLQKFLPGALVRYDGRFYELTDPWRRPFAAIRSLGSPIGTFADKLRVALFRSNALRGTIDNCFRAPEITSIQALKEAGFSSSMIERFFRPFLGGIFLDPQLLTSNRMLQFVFRMFSIGDACLPAEGMEAISQQLASTLPKETIRLNTKVVSVESGKVSLANGEQISAGAIIVATEGPMAKKLLGELQEDPIANSGQGVTTLYFSARQPPIDKPILVLNGDGNGPINNLCIPTLNSPTYGDGENHLVSVTVLGADFDSDTLREKVVKQLIDWFGQPVLDWNHLRTYTIRYALPSQPPPALGHPERSVRRSPGIYVCGDHRDNASIQGAMVSGRRAAEAFIEDRV